VVWKGKLLGFGLWLCLALSVKAQEARIETPAPVRLGFGDQVKISVLDFPELSGNHTLTPTGTITLPEVGELRIAGETLAETAQTITEKLKPFVKRPFVSIQLLFMHPPVVNVQGEVRDPGPVQLTSLSTIPNLVTLNATGGQALRLPLLTTALMAAGGVTTDADLSNITLSRMGTKGVTTQTINLWKIFSEATAQSDTYLQDGDTISVPRASASDALVHGRLIGRSILAPDYIKVRVIGQVNYPGEVRVTPNGNLYGAIATAGGPTTIADLGRVVYARPAPGGVLAQYTADVRNFSDPVQVREGDIIFVPQTGVGYAAVFFQNLFTPYVTRSIQRSLVAPDFSPGTIAPQPPARGPIN